MAGWSHRMWQEHDMPYWEFIALEPKQRAFLIASEVVSIEQIERERRNVGKK